MALDDPKTKYIRDVMYGTNNPFDRREKEGLPTDVQLDAFIKGEVVPLGTTEKTVISGTYAYSDVTLLRQALDGERGDDQKAIADLGLQIVTTLLRKNRDYGGSAHKRPLLMPSLTPRQGLLVRMSDKVHRMISLLEKGSPEVNESLEDTFTDLIGYCMLWLTAKEE